MPQSITYYLDEIAFLKQNFFIMTNQQLLNGINSYRSEPIGLSALRHQCKRLGLKRSIQIRWSSQDIRFLLKNYQKTGNVELAELLTMRHKTYRKINGKRICRQFTKKHVEKKIKLLKLKRTPEELSKIRERNIESGRVKVITSENNHWSMGIRKVAPDEDVRVWICNGKPTRKIKIKGKFIPYTRWFYHNFIEPVPANQKIYHKDLDSINDEPENLEKKQFSGISLADYNRALPLIRTRIKNHFKINPTTREDEIEWQKQLRHLRNIERSIKTKLERILKRNNSIYKNSIQLVEV